MKPAHAWRICVEEQGCLQISQGVKGVVSRKFALMHLPRFQSAGKPYLPIFRYWIRALFFLPLHLEKKNDYK